MDAGDINSNATITRRRIMAHGKKTRAQREMDALIRKIQRAAGVVGGLSTPRKNARVEAIAADEPSDSAREIFREMKRRDF